MGSARTLATGRVVEALLKADGDTEVVAAVAAGRDLNELKRWDVLQTLQWCRDSAAEYPPSPAVIGRLIEAWTAKWGSNQPRVA